MLRHYMSQEMGSWAAYPVILRTLNMYIGFALVACSIRRFKLGIALSGRNPPLPERTS